MSEAITGIIKCVNKHQFAVRTAKRSYRAGQTEIMVHSSVLQKYKIIDGVSVTGQVEKIKGRKKLVSIETLGGMKPKDFFNRPRFEELTAIDPTQRFNLSASGLDSMRIMDLISPIGKGSRQLIVSPPKAGKTILLEQIVKSIHQSNPECRIIVLLIDERPEEVTHFKRATEGAEVISSTSDNSAAEHTELANLMLNHVQIELECGRDVVVLIDSLTRLGRAFNSASRNRNARGHTMSGGLEAGILEVPRRLFGLARAVENGGAVTIIATCLINTGSRMDQMIFEEFKGTGNSEIVLDRSLAEARIFPAVDIPASGTRKEEKLYSPEENKGLATLRRVLSSYEPKEAMGSLFKLLKQYPTNEEFLKAMSSQAG